MTKTVTKIDAIKIITAQTALGNVYDQVVSNKVNMRKPFPTKNPTAITKENILHFFRRPRTKAQAQTYFGAQMSVDTKKPLTKEQTEAVLAGNLDILPMKDTRHSARFSWIFDRLVEKGYFSVMELKPGHITFRTQKGNYAPRRDDQVPAEGTSNAAV